LHARPLQASLDEIEILRHLHRAQPPSTNIDLTSSTSGLSIRLQPMQSDSGALINPAMSSSEPFPKTLFSKPNSAATHPSSPVGSDFIVECWGWLRAESRLMVLVFEPLGPSLLDILLEHEFAPCSPGQVHLIARQLLMAIDRKYFTF